MSNRILTADGWERRIQDKLGVDPAYLPDSTIGQPDFITLAETNIIKQLPDYESLVDDNHVYLEAAVVCECSALICPSMPVRLPKKESGPNAGHELGIDWKQLKVDLEAERDGHISTILDDISPTPPILHFAATKPVRGW
jgi:hypothetical protein